MAKFIVRSRKGPGDTFKRVAEIDAPHKPDGSHFENVMRAHVVERVHNDTPIKEYEQFAVQHVQSGDIKTFRVNVEPIIREL